MKTYTYVTPLSIPEITHALTDHPANLWHDSSIKSKVNGQQINLSYDSGLPTFKQRKDIFWFHFYGTLIASPQGTTIQGVYRFSQKCYISAAVICFLGLILGIFAIAEFSAHGFGALWIPIALAVFWSVFGSYLIRKARREGFEELDKHLKKQLQAQLQRVVDDRQNEERVQ